MLRPVRTDSRRDAMKTLSKQFVMAVTVRFTSAGDLESMWIQ